jgi:phospholipase/carboxylesterase
MDYSKFGVLEVKNYLENSKTALIMLHGYGANNEDLAPLGPFLNGQLTNQIDWYFPQAPIDLAMSPFFDSRAWFHIDVIAMQQAIAQGKPRQLADKLPVGLEDAAKMVFDFIDKIRPQYEKIIIGGFSQGAMLSVECALIRPELFFKVILWSGNLLCSNRWSDLAKKAATKKQIHFFQSHGEQDSVLSFEGAQGLQNLLIDAGHRLDFHSFQGQHEIPQNILNQTVKFLNA